LTETQDQIRAVALDRVDKLAPVKAHRKNHFFETPSTRQGFDHLRRDVVAVSPVRAEAVNQ